MPASTDARFGDGLHQRVDAEAQREVEHERAVLDQQIARRRRGGRRRSACRDLLAALKPTMQSSAPSFGVRHLRRSSRRERGDLGVLLSPGAARPPSA